MKKRSLFILCFLCYMFAAIGARAENFYIENYDVMLDVKKDNVVHIKETIRVYFTHPSHGIIRSVPLSGGLIKNIHISEHYIETRQIFNGKTVELQIGDANELISGDKVYQIEFDHKLQGPDNEFYYNIIGTDWGVPIKHARFYVKMPDEFDAEKAGLSLGSYGTPGFSEGMEFEVGPTDISGRTTRELAPYQGITLRIELPEGYFKDSLFSRFIYFDVWLGLLFCTLFSFFTWYKYGKDDHVTTVTTFNLPPDISSADAELLLNEKITDKGLLSLIVKLASSGYYKIQSEGRKFTLFDFKEYDGHNALEKAVFNILNDEIKDGCLSSTDLRKSHSFYKKWFELRSKCTEIADKSRFFETSSFDTERKRSMLYCILGNIALAGFVIISQNFSLLYIVEMVCAAVVTLFYLIFMRVKSIFIKCLVTLTYGIPFVASMYYLLLHNTEIRYLVQFLVGAGCVVISCICFRKMMKPNRRGTILKGQLLGFKKFLEVTETKRLKLMFEQNPQYFYNILPYVYIFGLSDVWMKQFENMTLPPPEWASGSRFDFNDFDRFTHSFASSTVPSIANGGMSSFSSGSSGSRSSSSGGGGFSGGGSGGGGGRSW